MNKKEFISGMSVLMEYFAKIVKPKILDIYCERLETWPLDRFNGVCSGLLENFEPTSTKPFPLLKDFLSVSGDGGQNKAQALLTLLKKACIDLGQYPSVDFGDRALHSTVERYGGWPSIVDWGQHEWDINEGRFLKALQSAMEIGAVGPKHLKGVIEAENGKSGHIKFIQSPVSFGIEKIGQKKEPLKLTKP